MFKKSLKYELRASMKLLVPLLVCVLALSIVLSCSFAGIGALNNIGEAGAEVEPGDVQNPEAIDKMSLLIGTLIGSTLVLLVMAFVILMCVASIAVFVLIIRRFYVSFFTDEGYLTFTLPVTVDCHLCTKILSAVIWTAICDVVIVISTFIFGLGFSAMVPDAYVQLSDILRSVLSLFGEYFTGSVVFSVISAIVTSVSSVLLLFFSISVGCMLTKKHRFITCALCVILISGGFSQMMSLCTSVVMLPFMSMDLTAETMDLMGMAMILVTTLLSVAQGVACYFAMRWILKNKVNLD